MSHGSAPGSRRVIAAKFAGGYFPPSGIGFDLAISILVLLTIGVSGLTLVALGWPYEATGGGFIGKIHPATFYAVALLGLALLTQRNPISKLIEIFDRTPLLLFYLATLALVGFHAIKVVATPITPLIDTFLLPVFILILIKEQPPKRRTALASIIHILMLGNATLGIAEFAIGFRLTPLISDGQLLTQDWRSTALLGHPLSNALHTGAYLLFLALGTGRSVPLPIRAIFFLTNAAAMLVFAGRSATITLLAILLLIAAIHLTKILHGARFNPRNALLGLIGAVGAAVGSVYALQSGGLTPFIRRFTHDASSAQARFDMFEIFDKLTWHDILWRPDHVEILTWQLHYGIEYGIESFWVAFILTYGFVVAVIFFAGFLGFLAILMRGAGPGRNWWLLYFIVTISTSLSLGSKTSLLAVQTIFLLVLLPAPQRQQAHGGVRRDDADPHADHATGSHGAARPDVRG